MLLRMQIMALIAATDDGFPPQGKAKAERSWTWGHGCNPSVTWVESLDQKASSFDKGTTYY